MLPKTLSLPLKIPLQPEIIQTGLADSNNPWMTGQGRELYRLWFFQIFIVGMDADRCKEIRMILRQGQYPRKVLQINAHAERVTDIIFAHIGE